MLFDDGVSSDGEEEEEEEVEEEEGEGEGEGEEGEGEGERKKSDVADDDAGQSQENKAKPSASRAREQERPTVEGVEALWAFFPDGVPASRVHDKNRVAPHLCCRPPPDESEAAHVVSFPSKLGCGHFMCRECVEQALHKVEPKGRVAGVEPDSFVMFVGHKAAAIVRVSRHNGDDDEEDDEEDEGKGEGEGEGEGSVCVVQRELAASDSDEVAWERLEFKLDSACTLWWEVRPTDGDDLQVYLTVETRLVCPRCELSHEKKKKKKKSAEEGAVGDDKKKKKKKAKADKEGGDDNDNEKKAKKKKKKKDKGADEGDDGADDQGKKGKKKKPKVKGEGEGEGKDEGKGKGEGVVRPGLPSYSREDMEALAQLRVMCPNCDHVGPFGTLAHHIRSVCSESHVHCEFAGCEFAAKDGCNLHDCECDNTIPRSDLEAHLKEAKARHVHGMLAALRVLEDEMREMPPAANVHALLDAVERAANDVGEEQERLFSRELQSFVARPVPSLAHFPDGPLGPLELEPTTLIEDHGLRVVHAKHRYTLLLSGALASLSNEVAGAGSACACARVGFSKALRAQLKVPPQAVEFCWCGPADRSSALDAAVAQAAVNNSANHRFVLNGGFVFFDAKKNPVAALALSLGHPNQSSDWLRFSARHDWRMDCVDAIASSLCPVPIAGFVERGAVDFTWINPKKAVKSPTGTQWTPSNKGAFVFRLRSGHVVFFDLVDDED